MKKAEKMEYNYLKLGEKLKIVKKKPSNERKRQIFWSTKLKSNEFVIFRLIYTWKIVKNKEKWDFVL